MNSIKKILIISAAFFPRNSPRANRTTELAKELSRQGHNVTVIIPDHNQDYSLFEKEYNMVVKGMGKQRLKEIKLGDGRILKIIERILFRFLDSFFEYPSIELMFKVREALQREHDYDLLISIAVPYPTHWGVLLSRRKKHPVAKIWVADCGDPYTGFERSIFYRAFYLKWLTSAVFRKCDFVTVPFYGAINAYPQRLRSKIKVIPQGFNLSEIEIFKGEISNPVPTFAYAGTFIPGRRDPGPFIDFLLDNGYDFRFNIYTKNKSLFKRYKELLGKNILIQDYIERDKLLFELSKMDFLVNFGNRNDIQLPSKIIDYALTGRPILSIDPYNFDSNIIKSFLIGNYEGRLLVNVEDYDIKKIAQSFIDIL